MKNFEDMNALNDMAMEAVSGGSIWLGIPPLDPFNPLNETSSQDARPALFPQGPLSPAPVSPGPQVRIPFCYVETAAQPTNSKKYPAAYDQKYAAGFSVSSNCAVLP